MALEVLELLGGLAECWFWFSLTGSCLVWVVTLGKVWLVDDHPHWAALIGIMLHVAVISAVVYFWKGTNSQGNVNSAEGKKTSASAVATPGALRMAGESA
jgi:Na+/melibiose symporter-like transporter